MKNIFFSILLLAYTQTGAQTTPQNIDKAHFELAVLVLDTWLADPKNEKADGKNLLEVAKKDCKGKGVECLLGDLQGNAKQSYYTALLTIEGRRTDGAALGESIKVSEYILATYEQKVKAILPLPADKVKNIADKYKPKEIPKKTETKIVKPSKEAPVVVPPITVVSGDAKLENMHRLIQKVEAARIEAKAALDKKKQPNPDIVNQFAALNQQEADLNTNYNAMVNNPPKPELFNVNCTKLSDEATQLATSFNSLTTLIDSSDSKKDRTWLYLGAGILFLGVSALFYKKLRKRDPIEAKQLTDKDELPKTTTTQPSTEAQEADQQETSLQQSNDLDKGILSPTLQQGTWNVLGASVLGNGHLKANLPCQDNHYIEDLGDGWILNVVCDGAGSADKSDKGSYFVAKGALPNVFKAILEQRKWKVNHTLPSEADWKLIANKGFEEATKLLNDFANKHQVDVKRLACTAILVIITPKGILTAHIGDGRAAYCNDKGIWNPLMIPFKGEEANQTVFLTSGWERDPIQYFESRVIEAPITAYTLMSDGCENTTFDCSRMDEHTQKWFDYNQPSIKFFQKLSQDVTTFLKEGKTVEALNKDWEAFLTDGAQGFKDEQDDKTMIFGLRVNNEV